MPFASKRQQRAAFGGHIPGFSKEKAREWAHETPDLKSLPDRAPSEKGKPTLRSKTSGAQAAAYVARNLRRHLLDPATAKDLYDAAQNEHRHRRRKNAGFVEFCTKMAFALPSPGKTMAASKHVGSFSGKVTTNFLKPTGSITAAVTNPRSSIRSAMTKNKRP